MPRMSEPTPLGRLLKARRKKKKVSWKRLEQAVGLEDQTMMRWERGVTRDPPIGKVLLYAREVGISLAELAEAALPSAEPAAENSPTTRADSGALASVRDKRKAGGVPPSPRSRRPRSA